MLVTKRINAGEFCTNVCQDFQYIQPYFKHLYNTFKLCKIILKTELTIFYVFVQLRKRLAEKAKDGTLKANGEPKLIQRKRGRWDQTDDPSPSQKKLSGTVTGAATPTSWDNADVCLCDIFINLI